MYYMSVSPAIVYAVSAAVGVGVAFQVAANSSLGVRSASPSFSVLVAFLIGLVIVFIYFFVDSDFGKQIDHAGVRACPWWVWLGGIVGACYVIVITTLSRHVGVAAMSAVIFSSQMVAATVIDSFGWLDMSRRAFTAMRGGGLGLLVIGTILIALG